MSQGQPTRPHSGEQDQPEGPIRYGDVFCVTRDLASNPVAPGDANLMQSAETRVFGQTPKGGAAAAMQAAATYNEKAGLVGHGDVTDAAGNQGVSVCETDLPGTRIITETVGGHVVGQYVEPMPVQAVGSAAAVQSVITIGQALEATVQTAGDKPVDYSDAAAIQAAEVRAVDANAIVPGGLAATAQSAAAHNAATTIRDEDKIKLEDILTGATVKLAADKVLTRGDAEGVVSAELRNNPNLSTRPGGVAASMMAAAKLNENVDA